MKVTCPTCSASLNIDDKKLPAGGARIKCPSCQNVFPVRPPAAAVPLPGGAAPAGVPLPGSASAPKPAAAGVPLPGGTQRAVPLPGGAAPAGVPLPGAAGARPASAAVPLPGAAASAPFESTSSGEWEDQPTRAMDTSALAGARAMSTLDTGEMPKLGDANESWEEESTRVGSVSPDIAAMAAGRVPLPGGLAPRAAEASSVPLPGSAARITAAPSVALPGAAAAAGVPLPGGARAGIPLPGGVGPSAVPLPGATGDGFELDISGPSAINAGPTQTQLSTPFDLPNEEAPAPEFDRPEEPTQAPLGGFDFAQAARPIEPVSSFSAAPTQEAPAPTGGFDFSEAPAPQQAAGGFDFSEAPAPQQAAGGFDFSEAPAPQQAAGGFDFSEAPVPAPAPQQAAGGFDFSEAPAPAAPAGFDFSDAAPAPAPSAGFDFSEAPAPANAPTPSFDFGSAPAVANAAPASAIGDGFALDTSEAPAPAAAAPSFGEFDLGGGGGGGGGGDLEFDPTGGSSKSAPSDDLEADLSAPLPSAPAAPSGPADGLEMLSFIDDTAKDAGAKPSNTASNVRRFHLRRRSGKVFGPFEDSVILKMLEDGQLLGNEEISPDGDAWQPIGSESLFQAAIAKLMESPAAATATAPQPGAAGEAPQGTAKPGAPSMERLQQLYEGRMAAVAVVTSKEPVPFKKRVPYIVAGVAAAGLLLGGLSLGATPYGYFGLKKLFPAKLSADSREGTYIAQAKKGLLQGTYKGQIDAKKLAEQALAVKEYPEARAVWAQAVYALNRNYGLAGGDVAVASAALPNVKVLGETNADYLKALIGESLTAKNNQMALQYANQALADQSNQQDVEFNLLRAQAYSGLKQVQQAKSEYEQILKKDPKSARAHFGLAHLAKQANDATTAVSQLKSASEGDPDFVAGSVELAEMLLSSKDREGAQKVVDELTSEAKKPLLSPREHATALAIKADLVAFTKPTDAIPLFEEALKVDPDNVLAKMRLGTLYVDLHEPEKAVPFLAAAQEANQTSFEAVERYLGALIATGKLDEARRTVEKAATRFPGNARLSYLSGRVADALDKLRDAEDSYRRAIASDPAAPEPYLYLARLLMRSRRFAEAKPELEKGLEKDPNNAWLHVGVGELAAREREFEKAEAEFKKAIELSPASSDAFLGLARIALENGANEDALKHANKALELNPRIDGGKLLRGTALWKLGKLEEAGTELEAAKLQEPGNLQIAVTFGAVALERGELDKANELLGSALAQDPLHPDANFYMARLKNKKAEHNGAIESMKRAIEANPKSPSYHYWMGQIDLDAHKPNEALEEWKIALELDPKYAAAHEARGKVFFDRNQMKPAIEDFEAAARIDPKLGEVKGLIGDAHMKLESWDQAIADYEAALALLPDSAPMMAKLAQAYQEKHQYSKAVEWYAKATEKDATVAEPFRQLGFMYKELKKPKEAIKAFTKYLEVGTKADPRERKDVEDQIFFLKQ